MLAQMWCLHVAWEEAEDAQHEAWYRWTCTADRLQGALRFITDDCMASVGVHGRTNNSEVHSSISYMIVPRVR